MPQLRKVSPGEPISADWANALVDAVLGLARIVGVPPVAVQHSELGTQISIAHLPRFDLIELVDTIESLDVDKQAKQFRYDSGETDKWIDANQTLEHTADPQHGLYLAGERHLAMFHPAAGQRIPIPGVQFHFGKLAEDLSAGGSAEVNVYHDSGAFTDSTYTVTAYDWRLPAGGVVRATTPVQLLQHLQSKKWLVIGWGRLKARVIFGTLAADLTGLDSTTCNVSLAVDGPAPDSPATVLQPLETFFSGSSGDQCCAVYRPEDDTYRLLWVKC